MIGFSRRFVQFRDSLLKLRSVLNFDDGSRPVLHGSICIIESLSIVRAFSGGYNRSATRARARESGTGSARFVAMISISFLKTGFDCALRNNYHYDYYYCCCCSTYKVVMNQACREKKKKNAAVGEVTRTRFRLAEYKSRENKAACV